MEFNEILTTLIGLFSGGATGAISNLILLVALVITAIKIRRFLRERASGGSKKQARDDRWEVVSRNKSKDLTRQSDEESLDTWRKRMRDHGDSGHGVDGEE